MKKDLEALREKALLDIYSWGGLGPTPGYSGTIITIDRKLYTYHEYRHIPEELKKKGVQDSALNYIKTITKTDCKEIENFIKKKLLNKKHKVINIHDASFHIEGSNNGKYFKLSNISDENGNLLYFNANKLVSKIKGEIKNEEK